MLKKILFLVVLLFSWNQGVIANSPGQEAEVFMADIGAKVIDLLTNKSISNLDRKNQFREILETKFNVKSIGKFVLGRYWKQASDEEKEKFIDLFKAAIVTSYANRFKDYTSEKFDVLGSRVEKDGGITVQTQITRPEGPPIPVDWKIFKVKEEFRIFDVILDGISMSITQRSEYAAVIQQGGGTVQALISALENKAEATSD